MNDTDESFERTDPTEEYLIGVQDGVAAAESAAYQHGYQDGSRDADREYMRGRRDAIADQDLITREKFDDVTKAMYAKGREEALAENVLDLKRVQALEMAARTAKELRSSGFLGAGAGDPNSVLAYAYFLLDMLPPLEPQE